MLNSKIIYTKNTKHLHKNGLILQRKFKCGEICTACNH